MTDTNRLKLLAGLIEANPLITSRRASKHIIDQHTDRLAALLGFENDSEKVSDIRVALESFC